MSAGEITENLIYRTPEKMEKNCVRIVHTWINDRYILLQLTSTRKVQKMLVKLKAVNSFLITRENILKEGQTNFKKKKKDIPQYTNKQ